MSSQSNFTFGNMRSLDSASAGELLQTHSVTSLTTLGSPLTAK